MEQFSALARMPAGLSYGQLKLSPIWDDLRGDPRFAQILVDAVKPIAIEWHGRLGH
jgi:hypothetical protein